jgi:hypothetical protein
MYTLLPRRIEVFVSTPRTATVACNEPNSNESNFTYLKKRYLPKRCSIPIYPPHPQRHSQAQQQHHKSTAMQPCRDHEACLHLCRTARAPKPQSPARGSQKNPVSFVFERELKRRLHIAILTMSVSVQISVRSFHYDSRPHNP